LGRKQERYIDENEQSAGRKGPQTTGNALKELRHSVGNNIAGAQSIQKSWRLFDTE